MLYIPGYNVQLDDENVQLIVSSYLKRDDHNVIFLDWSALTIGNYVTDVVPNALRLSSAVSDAVLLLLNNGLNINNLHFVSHSLGAHLAGLVGRQIQEKSLKTHKIKRITCLDPAFPLFYPALVFKPVSKDDAEFVDIIHTDGWIYGSPFSSGTADFWPNGGSTLQPGCPSRDYLTLNYNDFCGHHRSIMFWAESVVNKQTKIFLSKKCVSNTLFKLGWCNQNKVVSMGIDCPTTAKGNYYVQTNGKSPFSKELSGSLTRLLSSKKSVNKPFQISTLQNYFSSLGIESFYYFLTIFRNVFSSFLICLTGWISPNFIDREKYELNSAKDVLLHAKFNVQRPTVLYFHGFAEKLEDPNQHLIIDSYLIRNDHNVLLIDWELLGAGDYVGDAIPNAKKLSAPLSDAVLMLLKNGLNINKLHFVSHSLGAHLAGLVGRKIKDKSSNSYKIKRITCLDPAFPLFYPPLFFIPISKSDAEFVDIIHTDGWIYGTAFRTGTADFYPNGGQTLQPGCPPRDYLSFTPNDFCSHHRSIKFWSESIVNINTKIFSSTKCYSYTAFRLDWCKQNEVVNMGIDCSAT
ncbi:unnamed protein product [Diamesa serratosioi]